MENLPKELWIEIFEYLEVNDLLSLTATCKNFYSIVVETRLIDKFTINLTNDRNIAEWNDVKRNYSRLKIKECSDLEKFMGIVDEIGENLRKIVMIKIKVKISILKHLFNTCKNLKYLLISELQIDNDEETKSSELPSFLDLKIYFEDSNPIFFEILSQSQAAELIIDNKCSADNTNFDSVKNFLKSQDNLQSLGLMYFSINTNLFIDNVLDFVGFRLQKFLMNNVYLGIENVARFQTFMMNHVDSLKCLNVQSPFLDISFFRQFSALRELHISHTNAFFDNFENIEVLTVENISGNWMLKFPNVKELTMIYKYGVFLGMYADLVKLIHLKNLTIIDSKIPELNIPFVKKLSLKNATLCAKRPFRYEENQIRELAVDKCSSIEWIADFLAQETTRLKTLRIVNMEMIDLIRKIIEDKCKEKLQTLMIIQT